jgi:hypothetical protein
VQKEFIDYILWTIFQEEFYRFIINNFKKIRPDTKAKLRIYLLKKRIYITIHSNRYIFPEVLFDFFQKEK